MATRKQLIKQLNIMRNRLLFSDKQLEQFGNENLHMLDFANQCFQVFKWNNVPEEIPTRNIEMQLFWHGKIAFIKDDVYGYFMLPFAYCEGLDAYGNYRKLEIISKDNNNLLNNKVYEIGKNCVVVRDNYLEVPPVNYARYYALKIAELFRVREKNNNYLKLPFIFSSTGDRGKDSKNLFEIQNIMNADNNEIAVISDAFNMLQFFDLKPQYFGAEIQQQIKDLKNEFYTWCGLKHLPIEKRERMIVDEVNIEDEIKNINVSKRHDPREEAVKEINKLFGLNIEVEVNTFDDEPVKISSVVASVAGGIHNNTTREQSKTRRE